ncbi:hypothetical protein C8F01DRAFT_552970 [Mycena amicta]|nr:hypothetical protein C8F01DRAFT_552970 [Mycena amicta]
MSSQPALLDREARGIHAGLKAILSRDVWSNYREADFQRKNLRRRYLQLLLLHPSSKEAKDAGTHLWMQTSYAFIALYKQRLLRSNNNSNNNPVEARKLHQRFRQFLAEEERFWQALVLRVQRTYAIALPTSVPLPPELSGVGVDEEAAAAVDAHSPERARNNDFGFLNASDPPANVDLSPSTAASILGKALICLGDIARYREQYRPAPHTPAHIPEPKKKLYEHKPNYNRARMLYLAAQALAPEEGNAAHQLAILAGYEGDTLASVTWYFRALCVPAPFDTAGENLAGVLTRALAHPQAKAVAENEEQLLEKEREEEAEPLRVRVEKFKKDLVLLHAVSRERESSPTTQLALSKHAARVFAALVSARALPEEMIVRVGMVAQGALWIGVHSPVTGNNSKADDREREDNEDSVKGKEKEKRRSKHKPAVPTTTILPFAPGPASPQQQQQHLAHLLQLHTALLDVGIRELGEVDVYVGVPVVTTAPIPLPQPQPHVHVAGGRSRRTRPGRSHPNPTHNHPVPIPAVSRPVEELQQTQTPAKTKTTKKTELAERITAVFRRTLPALRVGSKWLLANWGLVDAGAAARDREQEREGSEKELETFWSTYAQFLRLLAKTFPEEELPTLTVAVAVSDGDGGSDGHESEQLDVDAELELEEDLDMRGWLPLRGLMGGPLDGDQEQAGRRRHVIGLNEEVHPNVEHLMRIRDLLRDGRKIAGMEGSPLAMYGGKFVAKGIEAEKGSPLARYGGKFKGIEAVSVPVVPRVPVPTLASIRDSSLALRDAQELEDNDDAMTEQTSRTADEIIHDAFSFLDNQGDEEEEVRVALGGGGGDSDEDEIVWDPRCVFFPPPSFHDFR